MKRWQRRWLGGYIYIYSSRNSKPWPISRRGKRKAFLVSAARCHRLDPNPRSRKSICRVTTIEVTRSTDSARSLLPTYLPTYLPTNRLRSKRSPLRVYYVTCTRLCYTSSSSIPCATCTYVPSSGVYDSVARRSQHRSQLHAQPAAQRPVIGYAHVYARRV